MTNFLAQNWGNVASVAGLAISVWVLIIARKAREAAQEARSAARLKSLVEVLKEASEMVTQIGIFLRARQWDLVRLRAEEVLGRCALVRARWRDALPADAKHDLIETVTAARSVAEAAAQASVRELSNDELRQINRGQIELSLWINTLFGHARRVEERG